MRIPRTGPSSRPTGPGWTEAGPLHGAFAGSVGHHYFVVIRVTAPARHGREHVCKIVRRFRVERRASLHQALPETFVILSILVLKFSDRHCIGCTPEVRRMRALPVALPSISTFTLCALLMPSAAAASIADAEGPVTQAALCDDTAPDPWFGSFDQQKRAGAAKGSDRRKAFRGHHLASRARRRTQSQTGCGVRTRTTAGMAEALAIERQHIRQGTPRPLPGFASIASPNGNKAPRRGSAHARLDRRERARPRA